MDIGGGSGGSGGGSGGGSSSGRGGAVVLALLGLRQGRAADTLAHAVPLRPRAAGGVSGTCFTWLASGSGR